MKNYGIVHTPLTVTVERNRRNPDRVIAHIANKLCFFENDSIIPKAGEVVEVMITRVLNGTYPNGHPREGQIDRGFVKAIMIQVVEPDKHLLVAIDGFECTGTMCRTTASGAITDGSRVLTSTDLYPTDSKKWSDSTMWLTPGRVGIFEASNVNVKFDRSNEVPRRPTNVWVAKREYEEKSGCGVRCHGLTRIEDGQWHRLVI